MCYASELEMIYLCIEGDNLSFLEKKKEGDNQWKVQELSNVMKWIHLFIECLNGDAEIDSILQHRLPTEPIAIGQKVRIPHVLTNETFKGNRGVMSLDPLGIGACKFVIFQTISWLPGANTKVSRRIDRTSSKWSDRSGTCRTITNKVKELTHLHLCELKSSTNTSTTLIGLYVKEDSHYSHACTPTANEGHPGINRYNLWE